jgi:hypothetical protein
MAALRLPEIDTIPWDVDQRTADEFMLADHCHDHGALYLDKICGIAPEPRSAGYKVWKAALHLSASQ